MTLWTLIGRSVRFHARAHFGVLVGAVIGSAALTGALLVGDSVRATLQEHALARLGPIHFAMFTPDRLFKTALARNMMSDSGLTAPRQAAHRSGSAAFLLAGTATRQDGAARANQVNVLGVETNTWSVLAHWDSLVPAQSRAEWLSGQSVFLNDSLAAQLNVRTGDELILRVRKPTALGLDAAISPRDDASVAMRLKVGAVLGAAALGDFSLLANQTPAPNAFLPLDLLARKLEEADSANLLVFPEPQSTAPGMASGADPLQSLNGLLQEFWTPEDVGLEVRSIQPSKGAAANESVRGFVEISTPRIFLEDSVAQAALRPRTKLLTDHAGFGRDSQKDVVLAQSVTNGFGVLTYLANLIQAGDKATPYSMITAAGGPYVPADMKDDEISVNAWLAQDLQLQPGSHVTVSYYAVDSGSHLLERTNTFRVRNIVPLEGIYADRTLMPEFPGVARAESTHDWNAGFPLIYKIRDKDEAYWKQYRGTPKAFITLSAGQKMWANRFGSLTQIRYEVPANSSSGAWKEIVNRNLLTNLSPAELGLRFEPVREQALAAANQSQDFGGLFIGFSFFLVVAALLLMAMLFQFGLEQRMAESGILLALGFRPRQVRRLLLLEGIVLAVAGGTIGALAGIGYARAMLWALRTIWRNAVGAVQLGFHASATTLVSGFLSGTLIAVLTIFLTLRKQARQPVVGLLAGEISAPKRPRRSGTPWTALVCIPCALAIVVWAFVSRNTSSAEAFFSAGSLLLAGGISLAANWLSRLGRTRRVEHFTLAGLGLRGCGRRRSRSLITIALLACGCFVIASIGVFRLDSAGGASEKSSGTGGFALVGDSSLAILHDLNTRSGREAFGLDDKALAGARVVAFRVHQGDEASCLNLNRAQKPRLLGVRPELLDGRFSFSSVIAGGDRHHGWQLLATDSALLTRDSASDEVPAIGDANSIQYALGKKVGDTIDYTDEYGRVFKLKLVGAVANSILQGSLIIDESEFVKRFPGESGHRFFLVDTPAGKAPEISATLSRALQDQGFELSSAVKRLDQFNAVQNTYLGTFQILGGLGLLLGSAGVGVVLLRNVLERRGELAVLLAAGFRRRRLRALLLSEHGALLGFGLVLGVACAAVAVLPAIVARGELPYFSLSLTLLAILLNGLLWTWLATRLALRGNLLEALRNE